MKAPYDFTFEHISRAPADSGSGGAPDGTDELDTQRMKTAERVRHLRETRRQAGLVRVEVYVPAKNAAQIRNIAAEMAEPALARLKEKRGGQHDDE